MAASDEAELVRMINTSVNINDKPSAFRYPRGNVLGIELPGINEILEIGKGKIIKEGYKTALIKNISGKYFITLVETMIQVWMETICEKKLLAPNYLVYFTKTSPAAHFIPPSKCCRNNFSL